MTFKQFVRLASEIGICSAGQFMLCWGISDLVLANSVTHNLQDDGCNFDELLQLQDKMNGTQLTNLTTPQQTMVDLCHLAFKKANDNIQGINVLRAGAFSLGALGYMATLQVINRIAANRLLNRDQQWLSNCNAFFCALSFVNLAAGAITSGISYSVGVDWLYNEHIPHRTDQDLMQFAAIKDELIGALPMACSMVNLFLYASLAAVSCKQYCCESQIHSSPSDRQPLPLDRHETINQHTSNQSSRFNFCQRFRSWCYSWFASDNEGYNNLGTDPELRSELG